MFIIETPGSFSEVLDRDIIQFGNLRINMKWTNNKFVLSCNSKVSVKLEAFKSYLCIVKWSHSNFIISLDVYNYSHRDDIPVYKLRPEMYWFGFDSPYCSEVGDYDIEINSSRELPCQVHAYPLQLTNIKYYNKYLDETEATTEAIKYTTNHKSCVFNDLARPINSGHGYAVK